MPNCVPAVHYTEPRHSSVRTSLSSAGVSWPTLMGYPSYARNRARTLPSPSSFNYVMAKIVPMVQLAAKSSTLCGRLYGVKSKLFGLMSYYCFVQLWCYAARAVSSTAIKLTEPFKLVVHFVRLNRYTTDPVGIGNHMISNAVWNG